VSNDAAKGIGWFADGCDSAAIDLELVIHRAPILTCEPATFSVTIAIHHPEHDHGHAA
jgi:hypothetical protein